MNANHTYIDQHLDDNLSSEDAARLEQWLKDDEHLHDWVARAELHTDLRRSLLRRGIQQQAVESFAGLNSQSNEQEANSKV